MKWNIWNIKWNISQIVTSTTTQCSQTDIFFLVSEKWSVLGDIQTLSLFIHIQKQKHVSFQSVYPAENTNIFMIITCLGETELKINKPMVLVHSDIFKVLRLWQKRSIMTCDVNQWLDKMIIVLESLIQQVETFLTDKLAWSWHN